MDNKKSDENKRVRTAITKAFFRLFARKKLNDITVTEIVSEAGVARTSFYRNYRSKEEVMAMTIRDGIQDFVSTADYDISEVYSRKNVRRCFVYFDRYKDYLLEIYAKGYGNLILEEMNIYFEEIAGTMPASSPERFDLYIFSGAMYNAAMTWLLDARGESAKEVGDVFCTRMGIE